MGLPAPAGDMRVLLPTPSNFIQPHPPHTNLSAPLQVHVMQYGAPFEITYEMFYLEDQVTKVALVAPSSTTHSTNMNQRVVGLDSVDTEHVSHSESIFENRVVEHVVRAEGSRDGATRGWHRITAVDRAIAARHLVRHLP